MTPSLQTLVDRIGADLDAQLTTDHAIPRTLIRAIVVTWALVAWAMHKFLERVGRDAHPWTAQGDAAIFWANSFGVPPLEGTQAVGTGTFTASDGSTVAPGEKVTDSAGRIYAVTQSASAASGSIVVAFKAEDVGPEGNLLAGAKLTWQNTQAGVETTGTVEAPGFQGGRSAETWEESKARTLEFTASQPQGGNLREFQAWALGAGAKRGWIVPYYHGYGTVGVFIVAEDSTQSEGYGPPSQALAAATLAYIEERRPITSRPIVVGPQFSVVDYDIRIYPDSSTVRSAVLEELADLHRRESEPGKSLLISHIREAISRASGEHDHQLISPVSDVTAAVGQLRTFGVVSWE